MRFSYVPFEELGVVVALAAAAFFFSQFLAFLIFLGVYARAQERIALPPLCYCVGYGGGAGKGGGWIQFAEDAWVLSVTAPLSGYLLITTVLKAS